MTPEATITEPVAEAPSARLDALRNVAPRDLGVRFLAGAFTSVCAGLLTLALGARVGGILLAFPAILAASLTLIAEEDDRAQAREDARGAVLGGGALAAFAAVAATTLPALPGSLALLAATAVWLVVAIGGYLLLWRRRE